MQLNAYQVGEYDIVAHYSPEQARDFLCKMGGCSTSDIPLTDVELIGDAGLDQALVEEDGSPAGTLRDEITTATEPVWLHGWE